MILFGLSAIDVTWTANRAECCNFNMRRRVCYASLGRLGLMYNQIGSTVFVQVRKMDIRSSKVQKQS